MQRSWLLIVSVVALAFLADPASAGTVSISGSHSANEIRGTCDSVGGVFMEGGGKYSCTNACGGELCTVECKSGKCTGTCPKCGARERPLPVLPDADAVNQTLNNSVQRPSKQYK
jgi:hypothetical protein